ncbi:MAG: FkbM family methyltransferase [Crocinitomicaceae bacterium]|nr:FkbM family methyltransferase [Crocinitomicaceae bacterium]
MQSEKLKYYSYPFRHGLISRVRDIDVKGVRKLSTLLPKWLLPNPKTIQESILKTIHGFDIIINPSIDSGVELSLFETGTYEKGILNFIEENYSGKGEFIDVGANIGLMSLFTASKFSDSSIICFEAHPKTYEILCRNVTLNNLVNVTMIQKAIGASKGRVKIFDNWHVNRGGASIVVQGEGSDSFDVDLVRMNEELADSSPEMIKIDVEGAELDVLKGANELIRHYLPIIIVEISELRDTTKSESISIVEYIKTLGDYKIFKLKGGKERKSPLIEVLTYSDLPEHDNIICIAEK